MENRKGGPPQTREARLAPRKSGRRAGVPLQAVEGFLKAYPHAVPDMTGKGISSALPPLGLECRKCRCRTFEVLYTRRLADQRVLRRRKCRHCGQRITTVEHVLRHG